MSQHDVNEPDQRSSRATPTAATPTAATPHRSTGAGRASAHPLQALQRGAGNRAVTGYVQRLAGNEQSTGGSAEGPAQPLSELSGLDSADFAAHLAQAAPASGAALQSEQAALADQLPSRQAPTGLPVGAEPSLPAPTEPGAAPTLPAPRTEAEPGQADELARQGGAAVSEAAADAQVAVPPTLSMVHPTETPPDLPALTVASAPPVPRTPAPTPVAGPERAALNASMNAEVQELTGQALAPALAADATHRTDVAAAKAGAQEALTAAETESTTQQRTAGAAADAEVRELHVGWQREKADVISSHQGQIQNEAGQTRADADRTMNEAQTQAQTAQQNNSAQRDAEPGLWDRVKSAGSKVAGAVGDLASGAVSLVRGIFEAAKRRVQGMISRLGQTVRDRVNAAVSAVRDGVRRTGAAISGAIQRGRTVVAGLANALAATAGRIWQAARQRLTQLWGKLTSAVGRAYSAAAGIAKRIGDALGKVKQIVKLLDNKLLGFMAGVVENPEEKVGKPLVALAAPAAANVPGKADEIGQEKAKGGPDTAVAPPVQRQAATGDLPAETFWQGVGRHSKAAGDAFLEHWVMNLLKVVASIIAFPVAACMEVPPLWRELVGIFKPEPGGADRLDHLLGVFRQLVNISAVLVAGVGVWAFLIGLVFPPVEPFLGAGYYSISMGVLIADAAVAAAQLGNAYLGASHATSPEAREMYLGMFSSSLIGAAITAVMVVIGAAAAWLAKVFRNFRALPPAIGKAKVGKGEAIGEPRATDVGAKDGSVPRPREWPYTNPPNTRTVPPGTPLELKSLNPKVKYLWVVDADGNFKFAPELQNSNDFMKPLPPDREFSIKHGDLQPGVGGTSRGPARAGGELHNVADADGTPSDMWCITNDSSYTFRRVDANGQPLPWAPAESVEAVRQHLIDGGTPGEKLVTTDVLAKERLERGVP